MINYCWDGLGWNGIIEIIFLFFSEPWQARNLSCCPVITSNALSSSITAWVDWGWHAIKKVTSLFIHSHGKFVIFLAVLWTQVLLFHDQILLG